MYYAYTIQCEAEQYYTGYTTNLKQRIGEHNSGKNKHTRFHKDWKVVTHTCFNSKEKALDFEKYLKSGSGIAFARKRLR